MSLDRTHYNRSDWRRLRYGPGCRRHRRDGSPFTKPPLSVRKAKNRRHK